jgi:hypothetical protein
MRRFLAIKRKPDVMIVIAQSDAQDFLGFVLLDDEAIKESLHFTRFLVEFESRRFRVGRILGKILRGGLLGRGGLCANLKVLADAGELPTPP